MEKQRQKNKLVKMQQIIWEFWRKETEEKFKEIQNLNAVSDTHVLSLHCS